MSRYGGMEDWKVERLAPWLHKFTDLEVQARRAEEEGDKLTAEQCRRDARVINKHIERLRSL